MVIYTKHTFIVFMKNEKYKSIQKFIVLILVFSVLFSIYLVATHNHLNCNSHKPVITGNHHQHQGKIAIHSEFCSVCQLLCISNNIIFNISSFLVLKFDNFQKINYRDVSSTITVLRKLYPSRAPPA
ncbi:MAG: hypothetical protein ACLFQV_11700 [Vulcanimicrobiota bacterium]